jgi:hypothetical protein
LLDESNKLPAKVRSSIVVVANVVVPVTTKVFVVVALTKTAESEEMLSVTIPPEKIEPPLNVEDESMRLLAVPPANDPPVITVLFKLVIEFPLLVPV